MAKKSATTFRNDRDEEASQRKWDKLLKQALAVGGVTGQKYT